MYARVIQYKPTCKPNGFQFGFGCQNGFGLVLKDIDILAADSTRSVHQRGRTE